MLVEGVMKAIQDLLANGDSFAAVEEIQRTGSPVEIASRYHSLVKDLYWKAHDLPALVTIGRAGILYCLGQSLLAEQSPELIDKLRSHAKSFAYDIGSFTWPGWDEPGIKPNSSDLAVGRDCALLNLRLAIELKKHADRLSAAHWLVGAHAISSGDFALAEKQFQTAVQVLPVTLESKAIELMNRGYVGLARLCKSPADAQAIAMFEDIIRQLSAAEDDDSKSFASQLVTARHVFDQKIL